MGFLDYIFGLSSSASAAPQWPHNPSDERAWSFFSGRDYWGGHAGPSMAGQYVREDDAIGVSCVFLSVMIYAGLLGSNPVRFYRRLPDDEGHSQIYNHPLLSILDTDGTPNPWQTGVQWRMQTVAQCTLWGLSLSRMKWGNDGLELWPVDSEHISQIDQLDNGKRRFHISEPGKTSEVLMQDQCFVLEGFGTHKLIPESLLRRSREAVGVWLAQQEYRSTYFSRGAQGSVVVEHPAVMSDGAIERFKKSVQGKIGGLANAHRVVAIEEGAKIKELGHTARNAQLTEAWDAQAREVSRFTGVPAYLLGADEQPPYASREPAMREFGDLQLRPRSRLIEAAYKRHLITEPGVVCEIDLSQIFRGDALAVAQESAIYVMNGVLSRDEVRKDLGRNPYNTEEMATPRAAVNQGPDRGGDPRQPREGNPGDRETGAIGMDKVLAQIVPFVPQYLHAQTKEAQAQGTEIHTRRLSPLQASQASKSGSSIAFGSQARAEDDTQGTRTTVLTHHHLSLLRSSASRLLRREVEQVKKNSIRLASNPEGWHLWLAEFYKGHARVVAEGLAIERVRAEGYTEAHRLELEKAGVEVVMEWEREEDGIPRGVREMMKLVTGEGT